MHTHCGGARHTSIPLTCRTCQRFDGISQRHESARVGHYRGLDYVVCADLRHATSVAPITCQVSGQSVPSVSRGNAKHLALGIVGALLTLACGSALSACPWPEPGLAPYSGDKAQAVLRLDIPEPHRTELADAVSRGLHSGVIDVTRDSIGAGPRWRDLRDMNFAGGRVCAGPVDRSMWPADKTEPALVYRSGPHGVLVFPRCGNVARVTDTSWRAPAVSLIESARRFVKRQEPEQVAQAVNVVPEPSTLSLLIGGLMAWVVIGWIVGER